MEELSPGFFKLTTIHPDQPMILLRDGLTDLRPEIQQWFADQGWRRGEEWDWKTSEVGSGGGALFFFTDPNRAMMFKLAWGGA